MIEFKLFFLSYIYLVVKRGKIIKLDNINTRCDLYNFLSYNIPNKMYQLKLISRFDI